MALSLLVSIPKVLRSSMSEYTCWRCFSVIVIGLILIQAAISSLLIYSMKLGGVLWTRTQSHIDTEREIGRLKYKQRNPEP